MRLFWLYFFSLFLVSCGGAGTVEKNGTQVINVTSSGALAPEVGEGDSSNNLINLTFTAEANSTIRYRTQDVDAVGKSDYLPLDDSLTVSAGQSYSIEIETFADTRIEGDEKFAVILESSDGTELSRILITILNDDFPVITVTPSDITEGDVGDNIVQFDIELSESTIDPFPLTFKTLQQSAAGFASAGSDYIPVEQNIVFVEGELNKTIQVITFGDLEIEPDEVIEATITHISTDHGPYSATIRSDDYPGMGAPTLSVNDDKSITVAENNAGTVYQVPLVIDDDGGFDRDIAILAYLSPLDVLPAGASDDLQLAELEFDFVDVKQALVLTPNQNSYIAEFSLLDDSDLENIEVLELILANEAGAVFGRGRVYITDNESPEFVIYKKYLSSGVEENSEDLTFLESSDILGEHNVYIELVGSAGYDYQFEYQLRLANGSEVSRSANNDDFVQVVSGGLIQNKVLTIEKGSSLPSGPESNGIAFSINDDVVVEGNESFIIELLNLNGSAIGDAKEIRILNDDLPEVHWVNPSITSPSTLASPFKSNEENNLALELQLANTGAANEAIGNAALETFNIVISRSNASAPVCSWRSNNNLSEAELLIAQEGVQSFAENNTEFSVLLNSQDDAEIECDEVITLSATLTSNNQGVTGSKSASEIITFVNTDIAQLDVVGFNASEADGSAEFQINLNAPIALSADIDIDHVTTEAADGSFALNSVAIVPNDASRTNITFDESSNNRQQGIVATLNNETMVELNESYQLNLDLTSLSGSTPLEIRQCTAPPSSVCTALANTGLTAVVTGEILNDDLAMIQILAKSTETVDESSLTALNLLDQTVAYPYEISLANDIADDIPEIKVSLNNRCLITPANDCADGGDYSISDNVIHDGISTTSAGSQNLNFQLALGEETVEPDELAKLQLTLDNSAVSSQYVNNWNDVSLNYQITNDDELTILISAAAANYSEGINADFTISWDKGIASNLVDIGFEIAESCDEGSNSLCTQTSDDGTSISGDIGFVKHFDLHNNGVSTIANPAGQSLGVQITSDNLVELQESSQLSVSLQNSVAVNPFLIADFVTQVRDFDVINTDKLALNFQFSNSQLTEGDGSGSQSANLLASWTENIASNVATIALNLSEVCDNLVNAACVSDTAGNDVSFDQTSVAIHTQGAATSANVGFAMGMNVIADNVVEPNEFALANISLANAGSLNSLLAAPWVDQQLQLQINNDDVITPVLSFKDDADVASGLEDTDKDLSSGNDVGLVLSWGSVSIADNTHDLILAISDTCSNCGAGPQDYNLAAGDKTLLSLSASGELEYGFTLQQDDIVEPDEVVQILLTKTASTPNHYFSAVPASFSDLSYTIENDERLLLDVVRADGLTITDISETIATPLNYSWLGMIADNVPTLNLTISENCDNDDADTSLPKCLAATTSLNDSPADFNAANSPFFATGTAIDASSVAQVSALQLSLNDDDWVELDEALQLVIDIPAEFQKYARFDTAGSSESAPDFSISKNLTLVSDDILQVAINSATVNGDVTDESAEGRHTYAISFDRSVEQDVPELAVSLMDGNTPAVLYASRSTSFAIEPDYRIFFGAEQSSDVLTGSQLILKAEDSSLIATSKDLILRVGDDDVVEDDETVAFSLSETNSYLALYDNGTEVVQGANTSERSFVIALEDKADLGIRFAANLVDAEVTSQLEGDIDNAVTAIVSGLMEFDDNLGVLQLNSTVSCKAGQVTCGATEANVSTTTNLDTSSISAASLLSLGFSLVGDQIVEPDETVEFTISSALHARFFNFTSNATREFIINNDDYVSLTYSNQGSAIVEGDSGLSYISMVISDEGAGIEGLSSIPYSLSILSATGDNAEETGSNKDFDVLGSVGSRSIDISALQAAPFDPIQHDLISVSGDDHIEADELIKFSLNLTLDTGFVAPATDLTPELLYTVADDDYFILLLAGSALQAEDSGQHQFKVCDKNGAGVEADFDLNMIIMNPYLDIGANESLQNDQLAILDTDFTLDTSMVSVAMSDIQNVHAVGGNDCALKNIPVSLISDSDLEKNEWFGIQLSASSHLCSAANNICSDWNLLIANDEAQSVLDSGVENCLKTDGTTESYSGSCTDFLIQDVEVGYPDNQYTFLDSVGDVLAPRLVASNVEPPLSYQCIQDDRSTLLWSIDTLPFDGSHSADGILWNGSILENTSVFEGLFSAGFCGFIPASEKWQLPSVEQLMGIVNYEALQEDGVFDGGLFDHMTSSASIYWSKDSCAADKYWAVNMKSGTLLCLDKTEQHHVRAVYY